MLARFRIRLSYEAEGSHFRTYGSSVRMDSEPDSATRIRTVSITSVTFFSFHDKDSFAEIRQASYLEVLKSLRLSLPKTLLFLGNRISMIYRIELG